VRNLRAARGSELRLGRQREPIGVEELSDDAKPPILREYLRRWEMETGKRSHQNRNSGESLLVIPCSGPEPIGYRPADKPGNRPKGMSRPLEACAFGL
jgi:hypothetical protein